MKLHFRRLLESDAAAVAIAQNDQCFTCQMVVLDLLRAMVECWIVFISQMIRMSTTNIAGLDNRLRSLNVSTLREISRIARDLDLAIKHVIQAALIFLGRQGDGQIRLRQIEVEVTAKTRTIKNKVDDFLVTMDSISAVKKTLLEENQALSVKRLTLLASIFLPLSLASSVLSMNTRVSKLGILWYDYAGLCSILVFCVFVVYQCMRITDLLSVNQAAAIARLLDRLKKTKPRLWALFRSVLLSSVFTKSEARIWSTLRFLIYCGLAETFVASFCVGIFKDVDLGLKILGYGTAGWCGLLLVVCGIQVCRTIVD